MLTIILLFSFLSAFSFVLGFMPLEINARPKLKLQGLDPELTATTGSKKPERKSVLRPLMAKVAVINKPLATGALRMRILRDLQTGQVELTVEEFFLVKELMLVALMMMTHGLINNKDFFPFWVLMCGAGAYYLPEFWLKGRVRKIKDTIIKELPDTVDLLGLCVNAGLDFMMAMKYVIEKSPQSVIMKELSNMMQEINVGKPRREALRDLARRYELPDLSTFSRTLIQADRMGTSVSEALNILSEDMREARFRRGEAMALKAPLKMLVPLLFFIFPVVFILVAGPIFLDFFKNNPMANLAK